MRRWLSLFAGVWIVLWGNIVQADTKIATLDWTVAETLLALDHPPVAIGDKPGYQIWVGKPELPQHTIDLGLRLQPNKESIAQLSVDGFINSDLFSSITPDLAKVAPVAMVNFYQEGDPWQNMLNGTRQIGKLINKELQAEQLIDRTLQQFEQIKQRLNGYAERPYAIVQFVDTRHLRFYGSRSLFGMTLQKLGLQNAWQGSGGLWGSENMSIMALADLPAKTRLIVVKPHPANVENALKFNSLWQHLELSGDPLVLPATWTFGALPSALIFAERLEYALQHGGEVW